MRSVQSAAWDVAFARVISPQIACRELGCCNESSIRVASAVSSLLPSAWKRCNRDIAQALFVTPKTVEVHLSNAYKKLGVRSRRDLYAAVGPEGSGAAG